VTRQTENFDGVILGSLCYKAQVHPKPRWAVDVVKGLRHPNKRLDLTPYITPYLSHDKELTKSCLKDKRICRTLSTVELIKAKKTNDLAFRNVDKLPPTFPVLVIAGKKDGVYKADVLPEILSKFGSKDIDVNIFPDKGHLLLEHQQVLPEVSRIFDRWLDGKTQAEKVVNLP
jgi:alpha-beta hydrolase superfamily lysophospholipase